MKRKKRKISIAVLASTAGVLVVGVAISLGAGEAQQPSGPGAAAVQPSAVTAAAFEVDGPQGRAQPGANRAPKIQQVAIRYYETKKPIDLATGTQYFKFSGKPCPKNAKAISGYSYYAGSALPPQLVVNAGDAPMTLRNWQFYLSNPNPDGVNEGIKFGVICAKHVD